MILESKYQMYELYNSGKNYVKWTNISKANERFQWNKQTLKRVWLKVKNH